MNSLINGKIWCLGDDIDTDTIIAGKHLSSNDPPFLAEKCLEGIESGWSAKISTGDVLVVGKNFGCGSSREHAAVALKATGLACVIAESFGNIFFRNAVNLGLPVLELAGACRKLPEGHTAEIDVGNALIHNKTTGESYKLRPMPQVVLDILASGGLLEFIEERGSL